MQPSESCYSLIREFEGCKLAAYICPAGVLTIGYGSTGSHVTKGMKISAQQADSLLVKDVARFADGVNKLATKCNQAQFDALVSFAFNLGLGNLQSSTLLKKHNAGDYAGAALEFLRWDKAAGKKLPGLTRRRMAESRLYQS